MEDAVGQKVYLSGRLCERDEARISVYDHGLLYGDGVFEGIRVYGGRIFRCREHLARLFHGARAIALQIPMTAEELVEAMEATLAANGLVDGYIRLVVTRGVGTLGIDPAECADPQVIIIADSIALYPAKYYEQGLEIVTASTVRNLPSAINPRIKSLNYLNNILAKIEGARAGAAEALMLNHMGHVAECTGDNIFVAEGGRLATPPLHAGILGGVTRGVVLELAREAGIEAAERDMTLFDVYAADECFLTGTAAEIVPVVRLDGRQIGDGRPGAITRRLLRLFREQTNSKGG
jgi:branched-chain amino acid aminotransferase